MAAYNLEEQEQLAEIKAWWKLYGNRLLNVALVAAVIVLGWQGWNWRQRAQSGEAAAIYSALQKAIQGEDTQRVKAASGELLEKFDGTPYAAMAALTSAKAMVEAGDAQTARAQLLWASGNAREELRDLARLRAATALLDEKAYDQALAQLDGASPASSAFLPRFQDLRGDILFAQGKKAEAAAAYRTALARLDDLEKNGGGGSIFRELIGQKIDALGGEK